MKSNFNTYQSTKRSNMELESEKYSVCPLCHKKIYRKDNLKSDEDYKPQICAECAFYRVKAVRILISVLLILGISVVLFGFIPGNRITKIIEMIISGTILLASLVYFIILGILKIMNKRKKTFDLY